MEKRKRMVFRPFSTDIGRTFPAEWPEAFLDLTLSRLVIPSPICRLAGNQQAAIKFLIDFRAGNQPAGHLQQFSRHRQQVNHSV